MSEFGQRLQYLRGKRDLTQEDLAKEFQISKSAISMYERGEREPAFDLVQRFADYFGVTVDYLMARKPKSQYEGKLNIKLDDLFPPKLLKTDIVNIPIVASIACGSPSFTEETVMGYLPMDRNFFNLNGGDYVWLQAQGDSMNNAGIINGSLVLIRLQPSVESGEIAAVCIDNESATLKRVFIAGDKVFLNPDSSNPDYKPLDYDAQRIKIVGVFRGVFNPSKLHL